MAWWRTSEGISFIYSYSNKGENKAVNINKELEDKKMEGKNKVVAKPSPLSGTWLVG